MEKKNETPTITKEILFIYLFFLKKNHDNVRRLGDLVFWLKMVRIEPVWDDVKPNVLTNGMRAAR